jgi:hypothetical protein
MKQDSFLYRPGLALFFAGLTILFCIPCVHADESAVVQTSASAIPVADSSFTVVQRIYQSDETVPAAQHRLLFDSGVIYDLPEIQQRIVTVYDPAKQQITMLDREAKNRTSVSTDQLVEFTAKVKAGAEQPTSLGIDAKVHPSDRVEGYTAAFSADHQGNHFEARYDVTTQSAASRKMAEDFGRFSDLSSRLNLLRHRGLPPFARMSISRKLTSLGVLPSETHLTVQRGDQTQRFRSTALVEPMSGKDVETIKQVQGMMTMYRSVALDEFTNE